MAVNTDRKVSEDVANFDKTILQRILVEIVKALNGEFKKSVKNDMNFRFIIQEYYGYEQRRKDFKPKISNIIWKDAQQSNLNGHFLMNNKHLRVNFLLMILFALALSIERFFAFER